jgi:hypothetical protein
MEEESLIQRILRNQEQILTNQDRIEEKLDLLFKQEEDHSSSEKEEEMIDLTEDYHEPTKIFELTGDYIAKRIFTRNDFKKLKGVDISALLNYDQTGLRSEKLIISKKFRRIRQTFYPNVEIYSQMTKDEMETKLRPEFEHIGSEFAAIFRSPNLKVQGIIKSEKFTAAFKRHFLSMIRGD